QEAINDLDLEKYNSTSYAPNQVMIHEKKNTILRLIIFLDKDVIKKINFWS
ncbi:36974_t:CDS:1, partial [Gigaspora margarita]